jgi:hypothetical protein
MPERRFIVYEQTPEGLVEVSLAAALQVIGLLDVLDDALQGGLPDRERGKFKRLHPGLEKMREAGKC